MMLICRIIILDKQIELVKSLLEVDRHWLTHRLTAEVGINDFSVFIMSRNTLSGCENLLNLGYSTTILKWKSGISMLLQSGHEFFWL